MSETFGGHRRTLLLGCLLAAALLTAALGIEAVRASRARRATVESVLRDYAALAAEQYASAAGLALDYELLYPLVRRLGERDDGGPWHPAPGETIQAQRTSFEVEDAVRAFFRLDGSGEVAAWAPIGAVATDGRERPLAGLRPALHATAVRAAESGWPFATLAHEADGARRILGLRVDVDGDGRLLAVWGVEVLPEAVATALSAALGQDRVLPRSMTEDAGDRPIVSVRVLTPGGAPVFAGGPEFDPSYAASAAVDERQGGLVVEVAIPPAAAGLLVEGGLPDSRAPLVVAMLLVTVGLMVAALALLRQERELVRMRERFVAGASHELRTPLTQIRMFSETLRLDRVRSDEERTRSLEVLDREARRLTYLVENLLQFSRPADHASARTPRSTHLGELAREVIEGFTPVAAARGNRLRVVIEEPVRASVDREMFGQILLNLLDNAVKYGPEGQTVKVEIAGSGSDVMLAVSDEGPGVAPAWRARVWERFWRAPNVGAVTGTGIGLALVRELVEAHGGTVEVGAAPAGGARFVVRLPRAPAGDDHEGGAP